MKDPEAKLMDNIRLAKASLEPTDEMIKFFEKRTAEHIARVDKFCKKIEDLFPGRFKGIADRGKTHDDSKYKDPEYKPYLFITWDYRCKDTGDKFDLPKEMSEKMNAASNHHVNSNRHHPEFHDENAFDTISRENRDKPSGKKVDASKMTDTDIAEMIADWSSMSEEKNEPGPKGWADSNVNVRWTFTDAQKDLIYELIEALWNK